MDTEYGILEKYFGNFSLAKNSFIQHVHKRRGNIPQQVRTKNKFFNKYAPKKESKRYPVQLDRPRKNSFTNPKAKRKKTKKKLSTEQGIFLSQR